MIWWVKIFGVYLPWPKPFWFNFIYKLSEFRVWCHPIPFSKNLWKFQKVAKNQNVFKIEGTIIFYLNYSKITVLIWISPHTVKNNDSIDFSIQNIFPKIINAFGAWNFNFHVPTHQRWKAVLKVKEVVCGSYQKSRRAGKIVGYSALFVPTKSAASHQWYEKELNGTFNVIA